MALCAIADFNCHCQCLEALIRHPGAKATAIPVVVLLPLPLMLLPGIFPRRVKKKKKCWLGQLEAFTRTTRINNTRIAKRSTIYQTTAVGPQAMTLTDGNKIAST